MSQLKMWNGSAWVLVTDAEHRGASDPHTQYHTDARGDARYYPRGDIDGFIAGLANASHVHDAADVSTGVLAAARLGTGSPSSANFLRGDGSWQAITQEAVTPWNDGATYMAMAAAQYTSQFADAHAFMRRVDAANGNMMSITMPVPTWHINYDGSNDVVVRITYSISAAPSAGNAVVLRCRYSSLALDVTYGTLTTVSSTISVASHTALRYYQHTFTTSSGWAAAGEIAHFVIDRQGTDGADTYTGDIRGHCVEILAKRKVLV